MTRAARTAGFTVTGTTRKTTAARTSAAKITSSIRKHTGAATGKAGADEDDRTERT